MNLVTDYINELGGYEVAKEKSTSWLLNHGENWRNVKDATLLEYRRQHNIYEAGDFVVSRCNDKETRIFKYETTIGKNIVVKCKKGKGYCYPKKWFSHATDAEIKVGKRLEVGCE